MRFALMEPAVANAEDSVPADAARAMAFVPSLNAATLTLRA